MEVRSTTGSTHISASQDKSPGLPELSVAIKPAVVPTEKAALVQQPAPVISSEQLEQALQNINRALRRQSQNLEFSVDESDRTIVRVVDQETKEVIRQMPTKEALEIAEAIDRMHSIMEKQKA